MPATVVSRAAGRSCETAAGNLEDLRQHLVRNEDVSLIVYKYSGGRRKDVAQDARTGASAGNGGNVAKILGIRRVQADLTDPLVPRIRNVEVTRVVQCHASGIANWALVAARHRPNSLSCHCPPQWR